MDILSLLEPIMSDGSAKRAGSGLRQEELIRDLNVLLLSLTRPSDAYRQRLIADTVDELEACYSTIRSLDRLVAQMEKESIRD